MLFSKTTVPRRVILLTNLGTPIDLTKKAVHEYLKELLLDQMKAPSFLIKTCAYFRAGKSLERYKKVWTPEGSPLMHHTTSLARKLLDALPKDTAVAVAMRYQSPSINNVLSSLIPLNLEDLTIVPLFPQQATPISQSLIDAFFSQIKTWNVLPRLTYIPSFFQEPFFITSLQNQLSDIDVAQYDHVLFSFHSVRESDIACQSNDGMEFCPCYRCQCLTTSRAIAEAINLPENRYTMVFQSSFGFGSWIGPSIQETAKKLIKVGKTRVLVLCPGFVSDCIETLCDIDQDFKAYFLHHGGERLDRVACLNDNNSWAYRLASFLTQKG
jgi:ferrochelatase